MLGYKKRGRLLHPFNLTTNQLWTPIIMRKISIASKKLLVIMSLLIMGFLMKKIYVINGVNLSRLGKREPDIYGAKTLNDIHIELENASKDMALELDFFQSNHEGEIVEHIHNLDGDASGIIINPGAYTHTSIAIRDALLSIEPLPIIELHISNIYKREDFRHKSYISDIADGVMTGFGTDGYMLSLIKMKMMFDDMDSNI